jgi:hypothetical protein
MGFQNVFGHRERIGFARLSGPGYIVATGGTVSRDGDFLIHTFTGSGTFSVTALSSSPGLNSLTYLIVAGGGGGGQTFGSAAGGGGAGGFLNSSFTATISSYPVLVGSGGPSDTNGNNSVLNAITSRGGGFGAFLGSGNNGGSGGGESNFYGGIGFGTPGQGFNGAPAGLRSGGGGGAFENGKTSTNSAFGGDGGNGKTSTISGSSIYYAGGGGGGGYTNGGIGGLGGGGTGGTFFSGIIPGTAGAINTGSGGGGSAGPGTTFGANGGSGIVIIRYFKPL